jgi:hypothetical protein
MFDLEPENGAPLLMDERPGVIVSDHDFTVNSAAIMVTETTITGFEGFDPNGKPEFVRARKAMQYSQSIEDFASIFLDDNNGGYANDWLIGDNHSEEPLVPQFRDERSDPKRPRPCFYKVSAGLPP